MERLVRLMRPIWAWLIVIPFGMYLGINGYYFIHHNILLSLLQCISTPTLYIILRLVLK